MQNLFFGIEKMGVGVYVQNQKDGSSKDVFYILPSWKELINKSHYQILHKNIKKQKSQIVSLEKKMQQKTNKK